jgi:hypothetical protein
MLGVAGVRPIDTRVAAVAVRVVDPDTLPKVAVIVVGPTLVAVARPLVLAALLMEAMTELEFQLTAEVTSPFEPSL